MVFVWSYLTDGDPTYTLVQVALNDLIMLFAFAPIVIFRLGVSNIAVPYDVLLYSVLLYIVIPLAAGAASRATLLRFYGPTWFEGVFLARLKPVTIVALLTTMVIIFAFQGEVILGKLSHIALIAIPLFLQVYFNSGLAYGLAWRFRVPHPVAAPGALIGASNFFGAGGRHRHLALRPHLRHNTGRCSRRPRRGAGHALGLLCLQPHTPLVYPARHRSGRRTRPTTTLRGPA